MSNPFDDEEEDEVFESVSLENNEGIEQHDRELSDEMLVRVTCESEREVVNIGENRIDDCVGDREELHPLDEHLNQVSSNQNSKSQSLIKSLVEKNKSLNPFGDDCEEDIVEEKSLNPFGEDDDFVQTTPMLPSKPQRAATIFSDTVEKASTVDPAIQSHRRQPLQFFEGQSGPKSPSAHAANVVAKKGTGVPLMFPDRKSADGPSAPVTAGISKEQTTQRLLPEVPLSVRIKNIEMGIHEQAFRETLVECMNDVDRARELMKGRILTAFSSGNLSAVERLWRPPLQVRITSWLPNIEDPETKELHTGYIMTICFSLDPRFSWQKVTRFSKLSDLHKTIYRSLEAAFPAGMLSPFPSQDWLKTKFFGVTDEIRDERLKSLDLWIRELMLNPRVFFDDEACSVLVNFLGVSKHTQEMVSSFNESRHSSTGQSAAAGSTSRRGSAIFGTEQVTIIVL